VRVWACEYDMNQMNEREYQMNLFSVTLMLMSEDRGNEPIFCDLKCEGVNETWDEYY
jgi:hypothetical protein